MPSVLKRLDDYMGPGSDAPFLAMLASIGVVIFGVIALTVTQVLKW